MRHLRLLLIVGLVLAVSSPAWALSLTGYTAGDPLSFHFNSVDVGPVYNYGVATTEALADLMQASPAPGLKIAKEDAWGIAYVSNITNPNNPAQVYWSATSPGQTTELTAMFVGTIDQSVSLVAGTPYVIGAQTFRDDQLQTFSNNFKFFMWEDTAKNYSNAAGPAARTGPFTYPTVSDGTLLLEADGTPAIFNTIGGGVVTHEAHVTYTYDITVPATPVLWDIKSSSGGSAYAKIADANGDLTTTGLGFVSGKYFGGADIQLSWTLTVPGTPLTTPWWDLADQDPAQMRYVPEPVTMATMLLGIGCLSRYIRKRR